MVGANPADYHISLLQSIFGRQEHDLGFPKRLRFDKIDPVFGFVVLALPWIELEFHGKLVAYLRLQGDHSRD